MSTYYNGSLNGFWTGHSDMRPKSKALSPSSDRGVETMGHTVKLGFKAQIGLEVLCHTYIYIYKEKEKSEVYYYYYYFEQLEHGNWLEVYDRSHGQRFVLSMMLLRISIAVIFLLTDIWKAKVPTKVGFFGLIATCGKL